MAMLMGATPGSTGPDGVIYKKISDGKGVIVTCRDEKHRQQVYKTIK